MDLLLVKTKFILATLTACIIAGACCFICYAVFLIIEAHVFDKDVLKCHSPEFVIQASLNMTIVIIFLCTAF